MFLLTTLIVKTSHFWMEFTYFSKTMFKTKLERLSIPNVDLSEKIGRVVIKTNFIAFLQIGCSNFMLKL